MSNPTRPVIPEGEQEEVYEHLFPIAALLIERGHVPIENPKEFGFCINPRDVVCQLTRRITAEDWHAINERFVLPDNIGYIQGIIRDIVNWVDIIGFDEISTDGVVESADDQTRSSGADRAT